MARLLYHNQTWILDKNQHLRTIQNVLAQEGKYEYRFPDAQIADYLTIDAQDSLVVEWIRNGSIESTELGIKCWARSANPELRASKSQTAQPVFNETITTIDPTGFNEQMYDYKTVNSSNFTVKISKYAEYNPCVFTLQNSAAENYTETSINIYISNATEREGSGTTYYQGISPLTNTSAPNETPPPAGASNASVLGSSMASLVVGLLAFTCLLAQ
ncbi:MAG: hypothetical protein L6R38_003005 [Xanthoria sp. 2 TBL-2021]|nr:MAG: hypothetical protein L6R38_003005 [Xanthoria sp. 2 TBL-2021]